MALPAAEADDRAVGKTASSRMQEMPLARKLRAAKPQVRRARRYWASEWSFSRPAGRRSPSGPTRGRRRGRRGRWAPGGGPPRAWRRWSCPAPAGPMSSTASVAPPVPGSAGVRAAARGRPGQLDVSVCPTASLAGAWGRCRSTRGPGPGRVRATAERGRVREGLWPGAGGGGTRPGADGGGLAGGGGGAGCDSPGARGRRGYRGRAGVLGLVRPADVPATGSVGRQRGPHCVLHPVPLRLVTATCAAGRAAVPSRAVSG